MATTADMARILEDGRVEYTHVSGDGYPSSLGAILLRCYQSREALDKLFAGDHIEEMVTNPEDLYHLDEERDPTWPWRYLDVNYLYQDGAWYFRNWGDDDDGDTVPPLVLLTRETILADADDYGGSENVVRVGGFLDGLNELSDV